MAQENTQYRENFKLRLKEPKKYAVVMLNDDFTTMEFVVDVLTRIFFKSLDDALQLMMKIHVEGEAVVGLYPLDIAKSKVEKVKVVAREADVPLRVIIKDA